jgi:hypothetical protein
LARNQILKISFQENNIMNPPHQIRFNRRRLANDFKQPGQPAGGCAEK